jgi:serine/threonine protein kinase
MTLRDQLRSGPLPWRRAVEVAVAVAEGLAAAHAKGIVHRDLKPDNVFVTPDGQVKILDFGLARTRGRPADSGSPPPSSENLVTTPGMILGTVGYMSPEQVRGTAADARSDIFALGCVLYEMVTGRGPFGHAGGAAGDAGRRAGGLERGRPSLPGEEPGRSVPVRA